MKPVSHMPVPSPFGTLILLWHDTPEGPKVTRVLLPTDGNTTEEMMRVLRQSGPARSVLEMRTWADQIARFLAGDDVNFPLDALALETCSEFQQRVLRAEHAIPRGWVSTYGRIATHLAAPKAARAVGRALALNPFPIFVPCHRAIRSDMTLGGYQGGAAMKRALLEREGLALSSEGKVLTDNVYYSRVEQTPACTKG
ncbi:MAG: methylated-DNA--[protein]-cysteine S-methyltransferase [Anaerolineae bacterium]